MTENIMSLPGDFNDGVKGIPLEAAEKIHELDVLIAKTFGAGAGKEVFQWMKKQYLEGPTAGFVVDAKGQINALASVLDVYQREGQRLLVKNLEMRMKRANAS